MKENDNKRVRHRVAKGTGEEKKQKMREEAMRRLAEEEEEQAIIAKEEELERAREEAAAARREAAKAAEERARLEAQQRRQDIELDDHYYDDDDIVVTKHVRHKKKRVVSDYNESYSGEYFDKSKYDDEYGKPKYNTNYGYASREVNAKDEAGNEIPPDHVNFIENRELPWDADANYDVRNRNRRSNMAALSEKGGIKAVKPKRSKAASAAILVLELFALTAILSTLFYYKKRLDNRDFGLPSDDVETYSEYEYIDAPSEDEYDENSDSQDEDVSSDSDSSESYEGENDDNSDEESSEGSGMTRVPID